MNWNTATDEEGRTYYWKESGQRQYEVPPDFHSHSVSLMGGSGPISPWVSGSVDYTKGYGAAKSYGRVEFQASKRPPAKWARIHQTSGRQLCEDMISLAIRSWRLPMPSVIISVTGGASSLSLNPKQQLVFSRGLVKAAETACTPGGGDELPSVPWIITGGSKMGVMEMVGRAAEKMDPVGPDQVQIPCIGIGAWGAMSQHEQMDNTAGATPRSTPRPGSPVGRGPMPVTQRFGRRYLYGSERLKDPPDEKRVQLDPNHSHFLLVDDGNTGENAFGAELEFRTKFEDLVCNTCFGVDKDNDGIPKPPLVLLVVGGGVNTYKVVLSTLKASRPVVCLPDSGGAAKAIYQYVNCGSGGGMDAVDLERKTHDGTPSKEYQAAAEYLPQIRALGETPRGAKKQKQLSFFSTEMDVLASNDLSTAILSAILSDCESTTDAIHLAVRWRDPYVIRSQLDDSEDADPKGMSKALLNALLGREPDVVKCLIEYNVRPENISMKALCKGLPDDRATHSKRYIWKHGVVWKQRRLWQTNLADEVHEASHQPHHLSSATVYPNSDEWLEKSSAHFDFIERMPECVRSWYRTYSETGGKRCFWTAEEVMRLRIDTDSKMTAEYPHQDALKTDWKDLMLWAVMANEPQIAKHVWAKTTEPLRYAIWAAHIAEAMAQRDSVKGQMWREQALEYESWAVGILDEVDDPESAALLLTFASDRFDSSVLDNAVEHDPEAHQCRQFAAHQHCQSLSRRYFNGDYPGSNAFLREPTTWNIILFVLSLGLVPIPGTFFPVVIETATKPSMRLHRQHTNATLEHNEDGSSDEGDEGGITPATRRRRFSHLREKASRIARPKLENMWQAILLKRVRRLYVFKTPVVKFASHTIMSVLYISLLAWGLLGWPWQGQEWMRHSGLLDPDRLTNWELVFWLWTFLRIIEEYDQFHDTHDWKDYVFDVYNLADIISYFMIAMAIALRILGASVTVSASAETKIQMLNLLQFGYAFSLLLLCLRSITVLKVGQSAGVLIIMLGKMQAEIVNWVKVVVVFTIGFSFFFAVMMPGALQGGLLGAFELHDIETYLPPRARSEPGATLVPIFMWIYVFLATIVLVNLLIAQMSGVYEKISDDATQYWSHSFCAETVREYKDVRKTPAPLNLIQLVPRLLELVLNRCRCRKDDGNQERGDKNLHGFTWKGTGDAADRDQQRRENQREQSYLCSKFVRRLEEQEALSLESQVVGIKKRQDEIDAQQDQRLEAIVSALAGLKKDAAAARAVSGFKPAPAKSSGGVPVPSRKLMPLAGASRPPLQPPPLRPKQLALPAARVQGVSPSDLPVDPCVAESHEAPREAPGAPAAPAHGTTPSMPLASDEDTSVDRTDTAGDESSVHRASSEGQPLDSAQGGSSDAEGANDMPAARTEAPPQAQHSSCSGDVQQSSESSEGNPLSDSSGVA